MRAATAGRRCHAADGRPSGCQIFTAGREGVSLRVRVRLRQRRQADGPGRHPAAAAAAAAVDARAQHKQRGDATRHDAAERGAVRHNRRQRVTNVRRESHAGCGAALVGNVDQPGRREMNQLCVCVHASVAVGNARVCTVAVPRPARERAATTEANAATREDIGIARGMG